jgi:hypothetical protein
VWRSIDLRKNAGAYEPRETENRNPRQEEKRGAVNRRRSRRRLVRGSVGREPQACATAATVTKAPSRRAKKNMSENPPSILRFETLFPHGNADDAISETRKQKSPEFRLISG